MKDGVSDLNGRIAARVRGLRAGLGLSLEGLAAASGVSRSMISLVERGESSPTAATLERLATGLEVPLGALFEGPDAATGPASGPLSRRADQAVWRDPASGYLRREVSPPAQGASRAARIVEVVFPPGRGVAFENGGAAARVAQQVWVLEGTVDVTLGPERYRLEAGDCLAMRLDRPTMFHNPTRSPARYAVVTADTEPQAKP